MNPKFKYVSKKTMIGLIKQFRKDYPERKLIGLVQVGSHLFDLHTEKSDLDFKGIYIPSKDEIISGEGRKREISYNTNNSKDKNSKDDIDCTFFSITKMFDLLVKGEFNFLELINAPEDRILVDTELFKEIRHFKSAFTVINVSSFLGFIKREFRQYGLGINQISIIKQFVDVLDCKQDNDRLKDFWSELEIEGLEFTTSDTGTGKAIPSVRIGQRLFQWTTRVVYVKKELDKIIDKTVISHRKNEKGVDMKGLYHCQRLLFEARDLLTNGQLTIPFCKKDHEYLMQIRQNKLKLEAVKSRIEQDIVDIKLLEKKTKLTSSSFIENYHYNLIARLRIANLMV